jgi:RNA polymerase sigma-70 factor (ECF subfamily)
MDGVSSYVGTEQAWSEEELLVAVGRGDLEALRRLYRAFERPLYSLGIRWLGTPRAAEELVQEVTVRLWRKASSYDPSRGNAGSWIFGVARNLARDIARSERRHPPPTGDVVVPAEPWDEERAWQGWQAVSALRKLPSDQQRVVELAYVEQYTHSEIADALGIPLGTVKTRLYEGLRRLRRTLVAEGVLEEASS